MQEAELYLVGGALLLYLLDSALSLYGDELLFMAGQAGWHNVDGGVLLFGRRVLLPNPLLPGARLLRVCWSRAPAATANAVQGATPLPERAETDAFRRALHPLQWGVAVLLLLIAFGLPAVLYVFGQGLELLWLLAAVYALNLSMAIWLWRVRAALNLGARSCALLTVDLLLCPPFAINLARKITLQQKAAGDPLLFAQTRFGAAHRRALCALLTRRVGAELEAAAPDSAQHRQLTALRLRIEALGQ